MAPQSRHPGLDPGSAFSSTVVGGWRMSAAGGKRTLNGAKLEAMPSEMQRRYLLGIGILCVTMGSCQHGQRPDQAASAPSPMAIIKLAFEPPQTCRVTVDGKNFTLPSNESALLAALKKQSARFREARVDGDVTTPFKCFGHAIFVAQRAGFKRVGFIAEPLPAKPTP